MIKRTFTCPCCGWSGLTAPAYERIGSPPWAPHGKPPYESKYGMPSYEVCDCCGFEFGNDDNPGTGTPVTFDEYLREWIENGCKWTDGSKMPKGWNLDAQLKRANIQRQ